MPAGTGPRARRHRLGAVIIQIAVLSLGLILLAPAAPMAGISGGAAVQAAVPLPSGGMGGPRSGPAALPPVVDRSSAGSPPHGAAGAPERRIPTGAGSAGPAPSTARPSAPGRPGGPAPALDTTRPASGRAAPAGAAVAGAGQPAVLVGVDTTNELGPVTHVGQGFLHSVYASGGEPALLRALDPTAWRSSIYGSVLDQSNTSRWKTVESDSVPTTLILSDMWWSGPGNQGSNPPWSNWNAYRNWVETTVVQVEAAGYEVDFWEVYNEPDLSSDYYTPSVYATVTPAVLLEQFLVAYQAIKAVDSSAQVIGPSLAWFGVHRSARSFSMADFLSFAASNDLSLAALSWHFNSGQPAVLVSQVADARRELASLPQLGQPPVFIDEYGAPGLQRIPGWDVAYLAALNQAGVGQAERSCWAGDCTRPVLDGLLAPDGSTALADYWLRLAYARMSGQRVVTTSNAADVSGLASFDPSSGTVTVLVGRGSGCAQDPRCPPGHPDAAAVEAALNVRLPWASGTVDITLCRVPGGSPATPARPSETTIRRTVEPGSARVEVTIPALADGDAYVVRIRLEG